MDDEEKRKKNGQKSTTCAAVLFYFDASLSCPWRLLYGALAGLYFRAVVALELAARRCLLVATEPSDVMHEVQ